MRKRKQNVTPHPHHHGLKRRKVQIIKTATLENQRTIIQRKMLLTHQSEENNSQKINHPNKTSPMPKAKLML